MNTQTSLTDMIADSLELRDGIWYGEKGLYWSNLSREDNQSYIRELPQLGAKATLRKYFPQHEEVIFSPKRMGGVATLDLRPEDRILDAGCMWGALTVPLAYTGAQVVGIDQTEESLKFLAQRKAEEGLENLTLINADLKKIALRAGSFDKIVLNGVLEWIPEVENVEVNQFTTRRPGLWESLRRLRQRPPGHQSPREEQVRFLKKIAGALKDDGVLYLAIENRYDIYYFLGQKEPHCGIRFFSFLPHGLQNLVSLLLRGREFRNWTYSEGGLRSLLRDAGFTNVDVLYGFPGYHFPELVLQKEGMRFFRSAAMAQSPSRIKKAVKKIVSHTVFGIFKARALAPAFIVHARKI